MRRFIDIEGKRYQWRDLLRLRREQEKADRQQKQPPLFELKDDSRPPSQKSASARYENPTLFRID